MKSKVVILGAGESGVGAALLAAKQNLQVFVSDASKISDSFKSELLEADIAFEEGGHSFEKMKDADVVIKSPGIPDNVKVVEFFKNLNTEIISEIEFASRFYNGKIIGITGTNGKTTTTGLIYALLSNSMDNVVIGGNYGKSFARILAEGTPDVAVLELSSFQLDGIVDFKPNIAVLLNVTADHLDRYNYNMGAYADSKMRIALNQTAGDCFVYNQDDVWIKSRIHAKVKADVERIGVGMCSGDQYVLGGDRIRLDNPYLRGAHNLFDVQCAVHVAERMGVDSMDVQKALNEFVNLSHRMEPVGNVDGVQFVNDSKATNVDAVKFALEGIDQPIIWIAGGVDKGNDYTELRDLVKDKVKALFCLGVDNGKLKNSFSSQVEEIFEYRDINACVEHTYRYAKKGDLVLLSPACASFDLFKNYIDRGEQFHQAVDLLQVKVV